MMQTTINVEGLANLLDRGQRVTVVDIRRAEDRAEWTIPGSVHVDAYDALRAGDQHVLDRLDLPEGAPVVTVCGAGRISKIAAERFRALGYKALSLQGGMKAWSLAWNIAEVPALETGAEVVQVRRTGKGCLSYIVGSGGEAAVIDAAVDPTVYADLAEKRAWRIIRVLDTHVHADHLSRSRMLADLVGAELYMPAGAQIRYPHRSVQNGSSLTIGDYSHLAALSTPGHTVESTSYLLDGRALFTGDTLFLSGVGRPDLGSTPQEAQVKGRLLCGSIRLLLTLPSETLVLPGHTSEPVPFDKRPICSPLAEAGGAVGALLENEECFVRRIAERAPPTPAHHREIIRLNRAGRTPEGALADLEAGANRCVAG